MATLMPFRASLTLISLSLLLLHAMAGSLTASNDQSFNGPGFDLTVQASLMSKNVYSVDPLTDHSKITVSSL